MRYKVRWIWEYDIEETGNPEQYDFDSLDEVLHRSKLEFPNSSIRLAREAFRPNGGYCKSAPQHTDPYLTLVCGLFHMSPDLEETEDLLSTYRGFRDNGKLSVNWTKMVVCVNLS
ncbi:hypothetical protein LINPERHAP1_LOCUS12401 [Linum perenne]